MVDKSTSTTFLQVSTTIEPICVHFLFDLVKYIS